MLLAACGLLLTASQGVQGSYLACHPWRGSTTAGANMVVHMWQLEALTGVMLGPGFIGGTKSLEGAVDMARSGLKLP